MRQINFSWLCIAVIWKCCIATCQFKELFRYYKSSKIFSNLEDALFSISTFAQSSLSFSWAFMLFMFICVYLSPLVTSFLQCLLWSLMGGGGLHLPHCTGRRMECPTEQVEMKLDKGCYSCWNTIWDRMSLMGQSGETASCSLPLHLFGVGSGVKSHSLLSSWQVSYRGVSITSHRCCLCSVFHELQKEEREVACVM